MKTDNEPLKRRIGFHKIKSSRRPYERRPHVFRLQFVTTQTLHDFRRFFGDVRPERLVIT